MAFELAITGAVVGFLLAGPLYLWLWRWRCPNCGRRRLRFLGLASEWSAEWVERRFPEGRCDECGQYAVRRSGPLGRWEPVRPAEPPLHPTAAE